MLRILCTAAIAAIVGISLVILTGLNGRSPESLSSRPTIEQVQRLAELVVLRVSVKDIQTTRLSGYTGGIDMVLIVHGQVDIGCNLKTARFVSIDPQMKRAVLLLSVPLVLKTTLDHDQTKVYQLNRSGLWGLAPNEAGEARLFNGAMQRAQHVLAHAADTENLTASAKNHVTEVLSEFFSSTGWILQVTWLDDARHTEAD